MKNKILLAGIFFLFFLMGCFDDEGNYDYTKVDAPQWRMNNGIHLKFRAGETATFRSSPYYTWAGDSAQRASEVTYEWKVGYEVVGNEANFDMPTDELIKRIGLKKLDGKALLGSFAIIDKNTGVTFLQNLMVTIDGTIASGDWYVISENGENTKFSLLKRRWTETGVLKYELKENIYPEVNDGEILGKPLLMTYAEGATNIDPLGSIMIETTSGKYEINCGSTVKIGNFEEVPIQGEIKLRHDSYQKGEDHGLQTFVTDAEGKLYRRMLTKNNLGGKFGTEPLVLDEKGYQITMMGQTQRGFYPIPCYDALHRRIVTMMFFESGSVKWEEMFPGSGWGNWIPDGEQFKLSKLCSSEPEVGMTVEGCDPVWDMPEGTEPLHLWYVKQRRSLGGGYPIIGMIYNDASGKTWLTEFAANEKTGKAQNDAVENKKMEFSGGNLPKGTCFLASSYTAYKRDQYILYSTGNQIRFLDRSKEGFPDNAYITLEDPDDRVSFMAWATSITYVELMVGTEKGKVIIYDAPYMGNLSPNPKIVGQFDLGGRIVSAKEMNNVSFLGDKY